MAFKFQHSLDAAKILIGLWKWDGVALFLKRWTPLFNPHSERYDNMPTWVKLPHLPFKLWLLDFFKLVGGSLGYFVEVDMSFVQSSVMCMGNILVNLDLRDGLAEDILIKWGNKVYRKPLDYMGVPFHYNRCHKYGHVIAQCDLNFKRKLWDEKHVKQWWVKVDKVVPSTDAAHFNNCMDDGILEDKQSFPKTLV